MNTTSKLESLIYKFKNHKWFSYIIFLGIVFLSLVAIGEGLQKAGEVLGSSFITEQLTSTYDEKTKEQLISIARDVDEFLLKIENSSIEKTTMKEVLPIYIKIMADINSLYLRNKIRPLNDFGIKQTKLLQEQWENLKKPLLDEGMSKVFAKEVRKIMAKAFYIVLELEVSKDIPNPNA